MIEITFLTNNGKVVTAPENSNLLRVSLREKGGIPFKERKHLSDEDLMAGYRMACQTFLNGDVSVSWVPMAERGKAAEPAEPSAADGTTAAGEVDIAGK